MAKNREVIQIHIGQAGNQIAYSCWQLYCLEHGIFPDGTLYQTNQETGEDCNAFFGLTKECKVRPRVLFIDLEPSVIDEIRFGSYRDLFSASTMAVGKEDAASNYARGKLTQGKAMLEPAMDRIRMLVEECSAIQGFMIFRALGGGTGSGFGNLILDQLVEEYKKIPKLEFDVFPSPKISPLIVEPYNAVLGVHDGMETIDCSVIFDNEALYDVCAKKLEITNVFYSHLNRIVAQAVSCITSSLRFHGDMNVDLSEFQTNLVPFKRVHFPIVSYAPLTSRKGGLDNQTTTQITNQVFDVRNQLVKCDPKEGKYISCCLLYRGNVCGVDINRTIQDIKTTRRDSFVDWCPTSFKIGINSQPPMCVPGGDLAHANRAVCMLSNNTAVKVVWQGLIEKFDELMSKKAFVHHYEEEGMEEAYLLEAREDLYSLIEAYKEYDDHIDPTPPVIPEERKSKVGKLPAKGAKPAPTGSKDKTAAPKPAKSTSKNASSFLGPWADDNFEQNLSKARNEENYQLDAEQTPSNNLKEQDQQQPLEAPTEPSTDLKESLEQTPPASSRSLKASQSQQQPSNELPKSSTGGKRRDSQQQPSQDSQQQQLRESSPGGKRRDSQQQPSQDSQQQLSESSPGGKRRDSQQQPSQGPQQQLRESSPGGKRRDSQQQPSRGPQQQLREPLKFPEPSAENRNECYQQQQQPVEVCEYSECPEESCDNLLQPSEMLQCSQNLEPNLECEAEPPSGQQSSSSSSRWNKYCFQ